VSKISRHGTSRFEKLPAILGGEPAFKNILPITAPTIPPIGILKKKYEKVLRSGMITNSLCVQEFEKRVSEYIGVKNAIAVSSCTSGLMLIIKALKLKGEVVLPSFTFHATAHAVVWNGLKPRFVDCDPETYNIDPKKVESAIGPNTCAILGVHIFGNPADVEELEKIAKKYKIILIFDSAHGFGSKYQGVHVGRFGAAESFSLSPTKLVTAGEGGVVTTNNDELAARIKAGRNYGDAGDYNPEFSGLNARMSEFNALLGIESLKMLNRNVKKRTEMVQLYKKYLSELPGISFQKIKSGNQSSYKDFSILIDEKKFGLTRDQLYKALIAENIVVKKYFYPPVHQQKAFREFFDDNEQLEITEEISKNILSLPLFSHISKDAIKNICLAIKNIYLHNKEIASKLKCDL